MSSVTSPTGSLVVTGWSAVSPWGLDRAAFVDGVHAARSTATDVDPQRWQVPVPQACLVPGFEVREVLGAKGTRSMDRVTGLAVSAVGQLLRDGRDGAAIDTGPDTGLVLGTTTGSVESMMSFTRSSLTADKPFYVDPSLFPNTVMNCAAGQCAIWYGLQGPNATIAGGRAAGLLALSYGRRLLNSRRARKVLVGAAEEYSNARSWLEHHSQEPRSGLERHSQEPRSGLERHSQEPRSGLERHSQEPRSGLERHSQGSHTAVLGEGCAMLLVEPAATAGDYGQPLAEVLAVESSVYLDGDPRFAIAARIRSVLERAGASAEDVWAVAGSDAPGSIGTAEAVVLADTFTPEVLDRVPATSLLGDTAAASVAFQIAAVLAVAEREPAAAGRLALVTSVDRDGTAGAALLRLAGAA